MNVTSELKSLTWFTLIRYGINNIGYVGTKKDKVAPLTWNVEIMSSCWFRVDSSLVRWNDSETSIVAPGKECHGTDYDDKTNENEHPNLKFKQLG